MTIIIGTCPVCGEPLALKAPGAPARQATYCGRKCKNTASKRRQRGRRPSTLDHLSDDQLLRIPQTALEHYGIEFE